MRVEHGDEVLEGVAFHRAEIGGENSITICPEEKAVAVWLPSNARVTITSEKGIMVDATENVDHEDVVSLDHKLREKDRVIKKTRRALWRSRRRFRDLDRPDRPMA